VFSPHVEVASYTMEHPSSTEVLLRCQTTGAISAEQGLVDALQTMKQVLLHMGTSMRAAVAEFERKKAEGENKKAEGENKAAGEGAAPE